MLKFKNQFSDDHLYSSKCKKIFKKKINLRPPDFYNCMLKNEKMDVQNKNLLY